MLNLLLVVLVRLNLSSLYLAVHLIVKCKNSCRIDFLQEFLVGATEFVFGLTKDNLFFSQYMAHVTVTIAGLA